MNMQIKTVKQLKQGGFVLTANLTFLIALLVMGATLGIATMRDSLIVSSSHSPDFLSQSSSYDANGVQFVFIETSHATQGIDL
jgi:hypothetical protein